MKSRRPQYPRRLIGRRDGGDTCRCSLPHFPGSRRESLATPGGTRDTFSQNRTANQSNTEATFQTGRIFQRD